MTFGFDESASFSDNCEAFLRSLEEFDAEMAAVLRNHWDALVAVVRNGERDLRTRSEFNSKVAGELDARACTPPQKDD